VIQGKAGHFAGYIPSIKIQENRKNERDPFDYCNLLPKEKKKLTKTEFVTN